MPGRNLMSARHRSLWLWFYVALAAAGLLAIALIWRSLRSPARYDLVIANVAVIDGTEAPPRHANIGIIRDRVAAIWDRPRYYRAGRTIDGKGLIAAPGFIDTHSHADASVLASRRPINAWNYVSQGVTTIVTGNCGRSPANVEDLAGAVNRYGINVNVAALIGHNTVKKDVMGAHANGAPSAAQMQRMKDLVSRAMEAGAVGISTGLAYLPGRFSSRAEIVALLEVAASFGGIHTSHIRNEGADGYEALDEVVQASKEARIRLLVSHFKITGSSTCGDLDRRLRLIEEGRRAGLSIDYDFYPYTASSTNLEPLLPDWYSALDAKDRRRILRTDREGQRQRLFGDISRILAAEGWIDLGFARVALAGNRRRWIGLRIPQIAGLEYGGRQLDRQFRVLEDLLEIGDVQMIYHSLCRDVMMRIASDRHTMVGSDSAIRNQADGYQSHPRGCGTFPRFLAKFVKDEGLLSWSEAVWRLTGLSAQTFQLARRGLLRVGYHADVVVFDPEAIRDRATYDHPLRTAQGIVYVLVNGEVVYEDGKVTSRMPGQFLRRGVD